MNERERAMCDDMFLKDGAFEILKERVRSSTKAAEDFERLAEKVDDPELKAGLLRLVDDDRRAVKDCSPGGKNYIAVQRTCKEYASDVGVEPPTDAL